jgi:hypothetical protein
MSEVVFLSAVFLLLIGAIGFYFYSRITYSDRKMNYLESILIDLRLKSEMEKQRSVFVPPPIPVKEPEPFAQEDSEELGEKDEKAFYNSVIDLAVPEEKPNNVEDATNEVPPTVVDYDQMSRDEVAAIAEKKSIRITKRMNKATIVSLLRETEKNSSTMTETGKDGGAPTGTANPLPMEGTESGAPISNNNTLSD